MNEEEIIKKYHIELAKKGGQAIKKKMGNGYFSLLGKRSGEAKRERKKMLDKKSYPQSKFDTITAETYNENINKTI